MSSFLKALMQLRPGAEWTVPNDENGNPVCDISKVIWHDATIPPTQQEIAMEEGKIKANESILEQINALEATITQRRMREAVLGIDGGRLNQTNDNIAALRAQLIK